GGDQGLLGALGFARGRPPTLAVSASTIASRRRTAPPSSSLRTGLGGLEPSCVRYASSDSLTCRRILPRSRPPPRGPLRSSTPSARAATSSNVCHAAFSNA